MPYIGGIHRHIKSCVAGFLEELNTLAGEERKVIEKAFLDEVGDVFEAIDAGEVEKERAVVGMQVDVADMIEAHPPNLGSNFMDVPLD